MVWRAHTDHLQLTLLCTECGARRTLAVAALADARGDDQRRMGATIASALRASTVPHHVEALSRVAELAAWHALRRLGCDDGRRAPPPAEPFVVMLAEGRTRFLGCEIPGHPMHIFLDVDAGDPNPVATVTAELVAQGLPRELAKAHATEVVTTAYARQAWRPVGLSP